MVMITDSVKVDISGFPNIRDYQWDAIVADFHARGGMDLGLVYGEYNPNFNSDTSATDMVRYVTINYPDVAFRIVDLQYEDEKLMMKFAFDAACPKQIKEVYMNDPDRYVFIPRMLVDELGIKSVLITIDMYPKKS